MKEIDEKVVSMQFDNRNFERNVATSMTTLDKLKKSLKFEGVAKGFESISNSAKNINLSGLSSAVDTVKDRFSALDVFAFTALQRISNAAIDAAKNLVTAFTITPISTGFSEYELKMGSVQTIMASTGESIETVNKYLDELNTYSDQTIYSFADMTNNIGKFTNAGVKLEDAVMAIKGVSNEAAVSGANANEASRAMYNFAQALSAGYVKLIDWKSIENANMATVEFKTQLLEAGVAMGTLTQTADGMYSTGKHTIDATHEFNEALQDQWLTTDVLVNTLKAYADENTEIGSKAKAAATEVKTFSMLMDTLSEAAQSGWAQTWELIVGDFVEAKEFFTELSNTFGGIIDGMSKTRNEFLAGALDSSWSKFTDTIEDAGLSMDTFKKELSKTVSDSGYSLEILEMRYGNLYDVIKSGKITSQNVIDTLTRMSQNTNNVSVATEDMNKKLEKFRGIVHNVWMGDYANGEERIKALTEAGYDYSEVQNLVNKTVNGYEIQLSDLSKAELKQVGYTEDEIKAIKQLALAAGDANDPLRKLIDNIGRPSGRELLIESVRNMITAIVKMAGIIKAAWRDIFTPMQSDTLYNIIAGFNAFTKALIMSSETAEKVRTVFKGLFAIIDIVATITGGALRFAVKIVTELLKGFNVSILDVAESISKSILKFRDWVKQHDLISKAVSAIVPYLKQFVIWVGKGIESIAKSETVKNILNDLAAIFKKLAGRVKEFIDAIRTSDIAKNIISGLVNGLKTGFTTVVNTIASLVTTLIEKAKEILGIHSPSVVFFTMGTMIIAGLIAGLKFGFPNVWAFLTGSFDKLISMIKESFVGKTTTATNSVQTAVSSFGDKMSTIGDTIKMVFTNVAEFLKKIDIGALLAAGTIISFVYTAKKFMNIADKFVGAISGVFNGITNLLNALASKEKAKALEMKSRAFFTVALSLAVLEGAIYLLTKVDTAKLWIAVGAVAAIAAVLVGVVWLMDIVTKKINAKDLLKIGGTFLMIGATMGLMAGSIYSLSKIEPGRLKQATETMAGIALFMEMFIAVNSMISKKASGETMAKMGFMLVKMAVGMKLMVVVVRNAASLSKQELRRGLEAVTGIGLVMAMIIQVSQYASEYSRRAGSMILQMSIAMMLMVGVVKTAANISDSELVQAGKFVTGIAAIFAGMILVARLAGKYSKGAGFMLVEMAAAMGLLVGIVYLLSFISEDNLRKGLMAVRSFGLIFAALIAVSGLSAGNDMAKLGKMLVSTSIAIAILVGTMYLIAGLDNRDIIRGSVIIAALGGLFTALVYVSKGAKSNLGSIITMATAVGVLVGAITLIASIGDPNKTIMAATAISEVMLSLGGMTMLIGKAGKITVGTIGKIALLSVIVMMLGSLIFGLNKISGTVDPTQMATITASITAMLNGMATSMVILSHVKPASVANIDTLLIAMAGLALVVGELGVIMKIVGDVNMSPQSIASLLVMLYGLTGATVILGQMKSINPVSLGVAVLAMAGLGLVIREIAAFSDSLATLNNVNVSTMLGLSALIVTMAVAMEALAIVGTLGAASLIGVGVFSIFAAALGLAIYGLGEWVSPALVTLGDNLEKFGNHLVNFFKNMGTVNESVLTSIKAIAEALLILSGSVLLESITSWFTGESSLDDFGENLVKFGTHLAMFSIVTAGINPDNLKLVSEACLNLAGMAAALPNTGGLVSYFTGENSIAAFGAELESFGFNLVAFSNAVEGVNADAILAASIAAKNLGEMAGALPNTGGLVSYFTGENNLANFGDELELFGESLVKFSKSTEDIGDTTHLQNIATVSQALVDVAANVPNTGGLAALVMGENSIAELGDELADFGESLTAFSQSTTDINPTHIQNVATASQALVEMAANVPNSDGLVAWFTGENSIAKFGEDLVVLGNSLAAFSQSTTDLDTSNFENVKQAAINLAGMTEEIPTSGGVEAWFSGEASIATLGEGLEKLGAGLSAFSTASSDIKGANIESAKKAAISLAGMLEEVPKEGGVKGWLTGDANIASLGEGLKSLGEGLKTFSDSTDGISADNVESAKKAAISLAEMGDHLNTSGGLKGLIFGDTDLEKFGDGLVAIATGMKNFSDASKDIKDESMSTGLKAVEAFTVMSNYVPSTSGLKQFIFGEQSLATMGGNLEKLGAGLAAFAGKVSGFDEATVAHVSAATDAAGKLAEMSQNVPDEGGLKAWFVGDNSIAKFGQNLKHLGQGLLDFSDKSTDISSANVIKGVTAADKIAEMSKNVPDAGGIKAWFVGDNSLASFGESLPLLGQGIAGFSNAVKNINESNIDAATKAAMGLAVMSQNAPNTVGFEAWFGNDKIKTFADNMPIIGKGVKNFSDSVSGISVSKVDSSAKAATLIASIATTIPEDTSRLKNFGTNIATLGPNIASFIKALPNKSTNTSGVESIVNSLAKLSRDVDGVKIKMVSDAVSEMASSMKNLSAISSTSADGAMSALSSLGNTNVKSFTKGMDSLTTAMSSKAKAASEAFINTIKTYFGRITTLGSNFMTKFTEGMNNNKWSTTMAVSSLMDNVANAINLKYITFLNTGKYIMEGLMNGMTSKKSELMTTANQIANLVSTTLSKSLDVHSPSRVTFAIGEYVGEGFINGIASYMNEAKSVANDMGNVSLVGMQAAINKISDVVQNGVDNTITVTPVLDLSELQNGMTDANRLLGGSPPLELLTSINGISATMSRGNNLYDNSAVVDAINKLRGDISDMSGTTNIIESLNIGDDAELNAAFETIIRAARMERRV